MGARRAVKALFDTCILIDYLHGVDAAAVELKRYPVRIISIITAIEVLVGVQDDADERSVRGLLATFEQVELRGTVAERAVALRRAHRLKLPDALVYATAQVEHALLVTRNHRDFRAEWPDVRIPYAL
jgi:predicted nucleic acid-binding protein